MFRLELYKCNYLKLEGTNPLQAEGGKEIACWKVIQSRLQDFLQLPPPLRSKDIEEIQNRILLGMHRCIFFPQ